MTTGVKEVSTPKIYTLFLLIILCWSFSWTIGKVALEHISPFWFASLRLSIATPAMFFVSMLAKECILPKKEHLPLILSVGVFQVGLFITLVALGLQEVESSRSALLAYTTPVWAIPVASLFFKEKLSTYQMIGVIFGMGGLLLLFNPLVFDWSHKKNLLGNAFLLLAAISWGVSIICCRFCHWRASVLSLSPWQLLIGTAISWVMVLFFDPYPSIEWNIVLTSSLLYNSLFATVFAFTGSVVVSRYCPVGVTSLSLLAVPLLNAIISCSILGESLSWNTISAMILIILGLFCLTKS